jgi:hypothetical protein
MPVNFKKIARHVGYVYTLLRIVQNIRAKGALPFETPAATAAS